MALLGSLLLLLLLFDVLQRSVSLFLFFVLWPRLVDGSVVVDVVSVSGGRWRTFNTIVPFSRNASISTVVAAVADALGGITGMRERGGASCILIEGGSKFG